MNYYNNKNEKFDLTGFNYYSEGTYAKVFSNDDIAFKVYKLNTCYKYYLSKRVFKVLKESNIPNIVKLIDYYHIDSKSVLPMDAYSMQLVKGKDVELLYASREYISDVLTKLEETSLKLTEKSIFSFDSHYRNIFFKENGVTIIDLDQFYIRRLLPKRVIQEVNIENMYKYFKSTIINEIKNKKENFILPNVDVKKYGLKNGFMNSYNTNTIYESIII